MCAIAPGTTTGGTGCRRAACSGSARHHVARTTCARPGPLGCVEGHRNARRSRQSSGSRSRSWGISSLSDVLPRTADVLAVDGVSREMSCSV